MDIYLTLNFFYQTPGSGGESGQGYDSDICYYPGNPGDLPNKTIISDLMQFDVCSEHEITNPVQAKRLHRSENHEITVEIATNISRNYAQVVLQRIIKSVILLK